MTDKQRNHLFIELWPRACETQGWNPHDRAKRLDVLSQILGREIASASEIDTREDYDAVKRELGFLADNLAATIETLNPEEGRARRLRETIRDQVKCLALYHPAAEAYLLSVIYDKFSKEIGWKPTLDDLNAKPRRNPNGKPAPSQLEQIMYALARGIQLRREKAGDSVHDMLTRAGLPCNCAKCCREAMAANMQSDLAGEENATYNPNPEDIF